MKKNLVSLILLMLVLFSLTACGNNSEEDASDNSIGETLVSELSDTVSNHENNAESVETVSSQKIADEFAYSAYYIIGNIYNNDFDDSEFSCEVNFSDETWTIDGDTGSRTPDELLTKLVKEMKEREYKCSQQPKGMLYIKYKYGSIHYVQYRDIEESTVIGQYPDPSFVDEEHLEWGVYHNATRCKLCKDHI